MRKGLHARGRFTIAVLSKLHIVQQALALTEASLVLEALWRVPRNPVEYGTLLFVIGTGSKSAAAFENALCLQGNRYAFHTVVELPPKGIHISQQLGYVKVRGHAAQAHEGTKSIPASTCLQPSSCRT